MPTDTFYPACDGTLRRYTGGETWQQAHDATTATDAYTTNTSTNAVYSDSSLGLVTRGFFTFDTSSLTSGAVITAATLKLYGQGVTGSTGSIDVVSSTQSSATTLATSDFNKAGTTSYASIDLSSWSTSAYNSFSLDASGQAQISKTGYTKLAVRHSSDRSNSSPGGGYGAACYFSEQTGTANDPVLEVTYTVPDRTVTSPALAATTSLPAPVVIASPELRDSFTDTNNTNLTAHTPESGTWTVAYDDAEHLSSLKVTSNQAFASRGDGPAAVAEYWHSLSFTDGVASADFYIGTNTGYGIVGLRSSTMSPYTSRNGYRAWIDHGVVTDGTVKLQKIVSGTITDLGSYSLGALTVGATYNVKIQAVGTALEVWVNGVSRITATDSSVSSAGVAHLQLYNDTGTSTGRGVRADNFSVSNLVAGGTSPALTATVALSAPAVTATSPNVTVTAVKGQATASLPAPTVTATGPTKQRDPIGDWVTVLGSTGDYYYAYPSLIGESSGNLRIVCYRSPQSSSPVYPTGVVTDGKLITTTSTDGGATWSAASVMPCNVASYDNRTGTLIRLANGNEAYVWFTHDWSGSGESTSGYATIKGWFSQSSDGWSTCTTPVLLPFKFGNGTTNSTQFAASGLTQLQNGDLVCVTFGRQVVNTDKWDVRYCTSSDAGVTWTDQGRIAAWDTYSANCVEPNIVTLPNGHVYMVFHTEEVPQRSIGVPGTVSGGTITWGSAVVLSTNAYNKAALAVGPDGDVLHGIGPDNVTPFYFLQSNDNGSSWYSQKSLMTGGRSLSPDFEDQWISIASIGGQGLDGNVGVAVGCGQGDLTQYCSVYFRKLSRAADPVVSFSAAAALPSPTITTTVGGSSTTADAPAAVAVAAMRAPAVTTSSGAPPITPPAMTATVALVPAVVSTTSGPPASAYLLLVAPSVTTTSTAPPAPERRHRATRRRRRGGEW